MNIAKTNINQWDIDHTSINGVSIWTDEKRSDGNLIASVWDLSKVDLIANSPVLIATITELISNINMFLCADTNNPMETSILTKGQTMRVMKSIKDATSLLEVLDK